MPPSRVASTTINRAFGFVAAQGFIRRIQIGEGTEGRLLQERCASHARHLNLECLQLGLVDLDVEGLQQGEFLFQRLGPLG